MTCTRAITATLIVSMSWTYALATSATQDELEARMVLMRYFDALTQGDTLTLRSLMCGDLLERRSRLLDNPTYPAFLVETNGSARFSLDETEAISPSDMAIEASIIFDQESTALRRFLLTKERSIPGAGENYCIYREDGPTTP